MSPNPLNNKSSRASEASKNNIIPSKSYIISNIGQNNNNNNNFRSPSEESQRRCAPFQISWLWQKISEQGDGDLLNVGPIPPCWHPSASSSKSRRTRPRNLMLWSISDLSSSSCWSLATKVNIWTRKHPSRSSISINWSLSRLITSE